MPLNEYIDPAYLRTLIEALGQFTGTIQFLARTGFDESSRLRTRVETMDDGYVRIRDQQDTSVSLIEILKEMSWTNYNFSEMSANIDNIKSKIDANLSTRASETTLSGIKTQTDKLTFDGSNRLAIQNPPNLDTTLSTRASESTLSSVYNKVNSMSNALASVGTDKLRATIVDSLPESQFNITKVSGTALTGRDWSSDFSKLQYLDTNLSSVPPLIRWGRNVAPAWVIGSEQTAPAANTALVSKTVTSGKVGYIYGFIISAGEANDFKINWTSGGSARSYRIPFGGKGAVGYVDWVPMNEGLSADGGTSVTITNVSAGSSGVVYQASVLYGEI
ncbi:MAG: hypothetical protein QXI12_04175 [Candidatus Methanomethyliaceae archaeon]